MAQLTAGEKRRFCWLWTVDWAKMDELSATKLHQAWWGLRLRTLPKFHGEKLPGPNRKGSFWKPSFFGSHVKLRGCMCLLGYEVWVYVHGACKDCGHIVMVIVDACAHKHLSCNSVYFCRKIKNMDAIIWLIETQENCPESDLASQHVTGKLCWPRRRKMLCWKDARWILSQHPSFGCRAAVVFGFVAFLPENWRLF